MPETLQLSYCVVVRDSGSTLKAALESIRSTRLKRESYEIIVVDDASRDDSVSIAARYADTIVRLSGLRSGPAYARNRGAELARGEFVAFIEADVVIRPDTLPRMLEMLHAQPTAAALSATRDEAAGATNFVSQYWNLLLRFGEEHYSTGCAQFGAGCGIVRRQAFIAAGMYDEWRFATECLESAELGERLREAGHGVILSPDLKVGHLRRWNLSALASEVWTRGRLLARTLGYRRMRASVPSEVVFTLTRSLVPVAVLLGSLSLSSAFIPSAHSAALASIFVAVVLFSNSSIHRFYADTRGVAFAIAAAPRHVFSQLVAGIALCTGWLLRDVFVDPSPDAITQAYAES